MLRFEIIRLNDRQIKDLFPDLLIVGCCLICKVTVRHGSKLEPTSASIDSLYLELLLLVISLRERQEKRLAHFFLSHRFNIVCKWYFAFIIV